MVFGVRRVVGLAVVTALVTGCFIYPEPPAAVLPAEESVLDFGEVLFGTHSGIGSVGWDNPDGPGVRTTACPVTGADVSVFSLATPFVPGFLPKGVSTRVSFTFSPPWPPGSETEKTYTASTTLTGVVPPGAPISVQAVTLTGKGVWRVSVGPLSVESAYFVDHQPLNFGKGIVGQYADRTVTVKNTANAPEVARIDLPEASSVFTASMSSGGPAIKNISVNANDAITLIITFSPTAVEVYHDALLISGSPTERTGTTLTGEGIKPAE
jgi:hypothetical protein